MTVFLCDGECEYSYDDLLRHLNQDNYFPLLKTHHLFSYFGNLVKALTNDVPLVLLDSDLSPAELDGVEESLVNQSIPLSVKRLPSMGEVIEALVHSTSEITMFTSGTTGQPKKVVHSIQTLTRSVRRGEKYNNQIWAYAYNPTHMAGLQVFFQAFENLNTLINVFNRTRSEIFNLIKKHSITHISATPTFYRLLLPYERAYSSVIRLTLGGEKSDGHLYNVIRQIFPSAQINNVYASTEAGSLFAAKGENFQIPASIHDMFQVVDDELLIHRSLLGQSDSFRFDGDYYHSGDLIEWINREEGVFKFKSRKNELINVGGYKVNPGEVENVLNAIKGIRQSLVFGKANSVLGNILCAEVQLEEGVRLSELEIRRILKDSLQDFKIPRRIRFVESFSLTRTGKLKRL